MFNRNKVIPDKNILIQKPDSFIKNDQDTHKEHQGSVEVSILMKFFLKTKINILIKNWVFIFA